MKKPAASDLLVSMYEEHLSALKAAPKGAAAGLSTGLSKFDELVGGLRGAVAIASPPGGGKTSLALNLAMRLLAAGESRVMFVSPELPRNALLDRLMANVSGLRLHDIRRGAAADPKHSADIATWTKFVTDHGERLVLRARGEPMAFAELKDRVVDLKDGADCRVLAVIDGLQTYADCCRVAGEPEKDSLDRVVAEVVDGWADPQVVSLLLSHMPKGAFGRHGQGVFSGSARIEYRVDMSIVLEPAEERAGKERYPVAVHVTKNWHGPIGAVRLSFDASRCRFTDGK